MQSCINQRTEFNFFLYISNISISIYFPAFSMASSGRDFDPRTRAFSDEELKPQPMIKKSRKQVQASTSDVNISLI